MPRQKSQFTPEYKILLATLRQLREEAGVVQEYVAKAMGRTQSIVSKSEVSGRRLDVVEVRQYCISIGVGFVRFAEIYEANLASGLGPPGKKNRTY